ncbi:MAG: glycosyltransferase family 4 protein [Gammaproteobacteria bacterium]|nr:glycosyltransferase family 4 protein [Gammaproteobacteria bacterium]
MVVSKFVFVNRFYAPDYSATSQLLTDLCCELANEQNSIAVVTSRQRYDDASAKLAKQEIVDSVEVNRIWTSRFGRQWLPGRSVDYLTFYTSVGWWLLWHLKKNDVVVAKTDPPMMSIVVAMATKIKQAKLLTWNQDVYPEVASALGVTLVDGWIGRIFKQLRNRSWLRAKVNVVLGQCMAKRLFKKGIPENKVKVIENWADGNSIIPIAQSNNILRVEWQLEHKFIVGYSGNMGRAHEFETILDAAEKLKAQPDIIFLFIGHGSKHHEFATQAKTRALNNIIFKPYQAREQLRFSLSLPNVHLISLIPEMEGLIVPSKFYGVCAAGRPTLFIGDKKGEVGRIVTRDKIGKVVTIGDSETLSTAILELKNDQTQCETMGIKARTIFEERYDKKVAMKKWKALLTSVSCDRSS